MAVGTSAIGSISSTDRTAKSARFLTETSVVSFPGFFEDIMLQFLHMEQLVAEKRIQCRYAIVAPFLHFHSLVCKSLRLAMNQGTDGHPGLMPLTMSSIMSMCEKHSYLVDISYYEVYLDRCYDLLEPKMKEVSVLEDKGGKIQLKGLSQVGFFCYDHMCVTRGEHTWM